MSPYADDDGGDLDCEEDEQNERRVNSQASIAFYRQARRCGGPESFGEFQLSPPWCTLGRCHVSRAVSPDVTDGADTGRVRSEH